MKGTTPIFTVLKMWVLTPGPCGSMVTSTASVRQCPRLSGYET
jgi:hypothetical protein